MKHLVRVVECGLSYRELEEKIKNGECIEYNRLKNDFINSKAVFLRVGGITYCYGYSCPFRKREPLNLYYEVVRIKLNLSDEEKDYLKKLGIEFVADEEWVNKHSFYPSTEDNGFLDDTAIPIKSRDNIEEGDVIVFFDYDEWYENGEFRTDRFYIVSKEHIEEYRKGKADLLPNGIVIKNPKNIQEVD